MRAKIYLYAIPPDLVPIPRKLYVTKWPESEIRENFMLYSNLHVDNLPF